MAKTRITGCTNTNDFYWSEMSENRKSESRNWNLSLGFLPFAKVQVQKLRVQGLTWSRRVHIWLWHCSALIDFKVFRCSATFLADFPHLPPMLWAIGVSGAGQCEWETMNCWSSLALIAVPRAIAIVFHHLTCILDESNLVTIDHYILCVSRCLDMVVALPSSSW